MTEAPIVIIRHPQPFGLKAIFVKVSRSAVAVLTPMAELLDLLNDSDAEAYERDQAAGRKWDKEEWPAIAEQLRKGMRTMEEDMRREELEEAEERRRDFERREFQRRKEREIERERRRERKKRK